MPDTWAEAVKKYEEEERWRKAEEAYAKTAPTSRFKSAQEIGQDVAANPTLLERGALGLEKLTGWKPVGDMARWAQAAEVEARTRPMRPAPGFGESLVRSLAHPLDALGRGAAGVSAALRAEDNLRPGQSLTMDEQMGRVAQGLQGGMELLSPLATVMGVGALSKAAGTLVAQGGKAAALQLARSAAIPAAGIAGGTVGGTLAGAGAHLAGSGPGGEALAQTVGGVAGGARAARLARQLLTPAPAVSVEQPVPPAPSPIRGLLAEPAVEQPVGTVTYQPSTRTGTLVRTESSYAELPPPGAPPTLTAQLKSYIIDTNPRDLSGAKVEAVFGVSAKKAQVALRELEQEGWLSPSAAFKPRGANTPSVAVYDLNPAVIKRATGAADVEARGRINAELGPSAAVIPERLLPNSPSQLEFAQDAAQRGYETASTNAGRPMYSVPQRQEARTVVVPETETVFPALPAQTLGTRQVPVSQALKELPMLEQRYGKRVDLLDSMRKRLEDPTLTPARRAQLEASVQQLQPIAQYIQTLRGWQQRFNQASAPTSASPSGAAGLRDPSTLEVDAQRATGVVGVMPRTLREKMTAWAEQKYQRHVNPEHEMNVRERASAAAGDRPVDATTGEPLAAYSPSHYTAWSRRGAPGVNQEIMDHPISQEFARLGTVETMKKLGLANPSGAWQTLKQGVSPVQQKMEHYLKVRTDLEDLRNGRPMTFGTYLDEKGQQYTPSLAELENVVKVRTPVLGKAAEALYDFRDEFIRKPLVEAGLINRQTYDDFLKNYKEHVPLQRALSPTGMFDVELRPVAAPGVRHDPKGALGATVPIRPKEGHSPLQAVDVLPNILDEAHHAHRIARANAAGRLVVKPAAQADAHGNIVTPAQAGGENMVRYPPGVEVDPRRIGLGMEVVRTFENGQLVDTVMPAAVAESLRVGIRQGNPTAFTRFLDALNGMKKAGMTSLRPGFALGSNIELTAQEVMAKSRGGKSSVANLVRYAPEWMLSRALPHGVKMEGPVGRALAQARANPGPIMRRLVQEDQPVPGRILRDAEGNVSGINLTAAFENARRTGAGGALGVMHEGNPATMAESLIYPPSSVGYWARSFRHPLQRLGHLGQRAAHVMSFDELGRIAADRATLAKARAGMVRDKGVLRKYTEDEAVAEGARDAIESLSDFTLMTPTLKTLQLAAPFVNPAVQSGRIHAKGLAGHRGVGAQAQEGSAMAAAALGGYLTTLYNLSDPERAKHYLAMSDGDRGRGWTWIAPNQQNEGPDRFTGHTVVLDGPMRVASDMARAQVEKAFGAPDPLYANEARKTLERALSNLTGLSSDESWALNTGMSLMYGLRPDGSPLNSTRGNAEASDLAKNMANLFDKGPGHMQAIVDVVPGSQYVFPRARPRDPYFTPNPLAAPGLEIMKRMGTVPATRRWEQRQERREEQQEKRGWSPTKNKEKSNGPY